MIQDFGHMAHNGTGVDAPQHKIKILGAVVRLVQTPRLLQQLCRKHQKMTEIIVVPQKFQIKIRLKMRSAVHGSFCVDFVFIRINHRRLSLFFPVTVI